MLTVTRRMHTATSYAARAASANNRPTDAAVEVKSLVQPVPPPTETEPSTENLENLHYKSKTGEDLEQDYVLTLATNEQLFQKVTALRKHYFPPRMYKVPAHLTLFHALPGSRLESDVIPVIESVVAKTGAFDVHAGRPFRLSKGIAISMPKHQGGDKARAVHQALQTPWREAAFLSDQDAGGVRVHWTIMNKVNDEKHVQTSFEEVESTWEQPWGTVLGLTLWKYEESGHWTSPRQFKFQGPSESRHVK